MFAILRYVYHVLRTAFYFVEYFLELIHYRIFGLGDLEEEPVKGKVAIVTGSNTGIGKGIAKELAERGATVILACRNLKAGEAAIRDIKAEVVNAKLELRELDLSDLDSVRKFASDVKANYPEIHLLVNNAGVCSYKTTLQKTKQGLELHMGVNHIGHFLLTSLLLDNLKAGAPSRVVVISSGTLINSFLKLDDLMMERSKNPCLFTGISRLPYNNSKMANALFAKELGKRLEESGVNVYSLCPGIVKTEVFRDSSSSWMTKFITDFLQTLGGISTERSMEGVLYCILSRKCEHETGKFYRFGQVHRSCNRMLKVKDAEDLWRISETIIAHKGNTPVAAVTNPIS